MRFENWISDCQSSHLQVNGVGNYNRPLELSCKSGFVVLVTYHPSLGNVIIDGHVFLEELHK